MTDIEIEEDQPAELIVPEPEAVAISRQTEGVEIKSLGKTWKLANLGLARIINEERDAMYNDIALYQDVSMKDVRACAWYMLATNYRIEPNLAVAIIQGADQGELAGAVVSAAFVHETTRSDQGYTAWARSSLLSNGLDPAKIDKADMPHVLRQLVQTKRAMPLGDFTAADRHAAIKADALREI